MKGRIPSAAAVLLVLSAAAVAAPPGDGEARPAPAPSPAPPPSPPVVPAAPPAEPKAAEVEWAKDPAAARDAARKRGTRILAVVTQDFYPSEPCARLEKALEDPEARAVLPPLVPLRVVEKEEAAFSKSLGLQDLGHPYTALLDAEGRPLAWIRGARGAGAWAKEVRRLVAGADALEARRAEAGKPSPPAAALWEYSEALRAVGRVREADDQLARAENADPENASGLLARFRFRRLEARVEDRMAVQDFEGARTLLDAYDREFPASPMRPRVALYRALARAFRGEPDGALEDLREIAATSKDEELLALAREKIAALEAVLERKK